ncbi:hypothetical protein DL767_007753 [Monosporascus sp. MG133]|nr:hypothetical protein DL767_007753 [Monosporascus sp. MG133]
MSSLSCLPGPLPSVFSCGANSFRAIAYINYPDSGYSQPFTPNSPTQSEALYEDGASDVTESFPTSLHEDGAWSADGPWPRLPFMDFMGQDAFQMALDNPAISRQLSEYCEDQGCEEDVEFLMKIQEYNQATDDVAAALTAISTSFTSAAAKNPLNLPPTLSGQLNADVSMQGPSTDTATVRRIQRGLLEAREVTELILRCHRDGEPFWNLFSLFPLKDDQGQPQYWLWAQIDVSESVTSRRDLLRVLNRGHNPDVPAEADSLGESTASSAKRVHGERPLDRADSAMRRDGHTRSACRDRVVSSRGKSLGVAHPAVKRRNPASDRGPFAPSSIIERQPTPIPTAGARRRRSLKLKIAFCSEAAAELLSIRGDATGLGIFQFLEQQGRSPSVAKSLKSLVKERIEFGKPVGVEILVDPGRAGLFGSRKQNRHASSGPGTSADADHVRSGSAEKLERRTTRVSKQEKLMTHWTPLKDPKGDVEWVVLILAPRTTT